MPACIVKWLEFVSHIIKPEDLNYSESFTYLFIHSHAHGWELNCGHRGRLTEAKMGLSLYHLLIQTPPAGKAGEVLPPKDTHTETDGAGVRTKNPPITGQTSTYRSSNRFKLEFQLNKTCL